jgi:hypothetical protein
LKKAVKRALGLAQLRLRRGGRRLRRVCLNER